MKDRLFKIIFSFINLCLLLPMFAHAALTFVGPVDPSNGFPRWYKDSRNVRLQLCLDQNTFCLPMDDVDPALPLSFPSNFPGESFWFNAGARIDNIDGGGQVLLVMAIEAAFAGGIPLAGERIAFNRLRIRARGIPLGTYRITYPYGQKTFLATSSTGRQINDTNDVGVLTEVFTGALDGEVGPFLMWDPALSPLAPAGFLGDPNVLHQVIGSPTGNNFLKVERLINGIFREVGFTNLFNVAGKLDNRPEEPVVSITPKGGIFSEAPIVTITSSLPATIFYTLDNSNPLTSATRRTYTGAFRLADCAALKFAAQTTSASSDVQTEIYVKAP